MSSTAPPMRPSTATIANGTRNQVGSRTASAPIGSLAIEVLSPLGGAGQQRPENEQDDGGQRGAEGRPEGHPSTGGPSRHVARVVSGHVDLPEPEAGIMNARPPMSACVEPPGSADTVDQWILSATRMMNITVSTPGMIVMTVCMRMIGSKPIMPPIWSAPRPRSWR